MMVVIEQNKLRAIIRDAEGDHDMDFTIREHKCNPFSISLRRNGALNKILYLKESWCSIYKP